MRVYCRECGSVGRITKTNRISPDYAVLYCQCGEAECGHTWTSELCFRATLSPSSRSADALVISILQSLSPDRKRLLISQLQGAQ